MADYTDLLVNGDNPGGTKQVIYFAPLSTFETLQVAGGLEAADLADVAVISTDHVFKTGGRFYKMELEMNKNEFNSEFQGAVRGNHDKLSFTGLVPGFTAAQQGLLRKARSEKQIVLIPLSDGTLVQLGEKDNGAMFQENTGTGTQEGGERGSTVTITAYHYKNIYTGSVSFTAAV